MNEGHAAFLTLELIREKMAAGQELPGGRSSSTRAECIFTTHTPVEAGHDRFSADLMDYAMHRFRTQLPVPFAEVMKLGRVNPQDSKEPFCMTVLALKLSRAANAVSELHGRVAATCGIASTRASRSSRSPSGTSPTASTCWAG